MLLDGIALETCKLNLNQGRLDTANRESGKLVGGLGGNPAVIRGSGAVFVGIHGYQDEHGTPCSLGLIETMLP